MVLPLVWQEERPGRDRVRRLRARRELDAFRARGHLPPAPPGRRHEGDAPRAGPLKGGQKHTCAAGTAVAHARAPSARPNFEASLFVLCHDSSLMTPLAPSRAPFSLWLSASFTRPHRCRSVSNRARAAVAPLDAHAATVGSLRSTRAVALRSTRARHAAPLRARRSSGRTSMRRRRSRRRRRAGCRRTRSPTAPRHRAPSSSRGRPCLPRRASAGR